MGETTTVLGWLSQPESTHRTMQTENAAPKSAVAILTDRRGQAVNTSKPTLAFDPRPIAATLAPGAVTKMAHSVPGGFPSPADDYVESALDFNEHLIVQGHRDATYVLRVSGWSMRDAGIHDGDEVIVDRALMPRAGNVVVAILNGDFTIKRLAFDKGVPVLMAENAHFDNRKIADGEELQIWGVVTRVLHKV